jgi:hypothetical protein
MGMAPFNMMPTAMDMNMPFQTTDFQHEFTNIANAPGYTATSNMPTVMDMWSRLECS